MFDVQTVARPQVTRVSRSEPNPFAGMFPTAEEQALSVTVHGKTEGDAQKNAAKVQRLARQAANDAKSETVPEGYTARSVVTTEENTKEKTGSDKRWTATVTIWSVTRETRPGAGRRPASQS